MCSADEKLVILLVESWNSADCKLGSADSKLGAAD
jgi:hypothetical protein